MDGLSSQRPQDTPAAHHIDLSHDWLSLKAFWEPTYLGWLGPVLGAIWRGRRRELCRVFSPCWGQGHRPRAPASELHFPPVLPSARRVFHSAQGSGWALHSQGWEIAAVSR